MKQIFEEGNFNKRLFRKYIFAVFIIAVFVFPMQINLSADFEYQDVGFIDNASAQPQIDVKLGEIKISNNDLIMITLAQSIHTRETLFVDQNTVIQNDVVQIQIQDRLASERDENNTIDEVQFTVRQFSSIVRNESTGLIERFNDLEIYNASVELLDGKGWGNIELEPTEEKKTVWITYRNVRIQFETETADKFLIAPTMTNQEFLQQMMGFALLSSIIALAGGAIGIFVEWRAKELHMPDKLQSWGWMIGLFSVMFIQALVMTFEINITREFFWIALFVGSMYLGIKSYEYEFSKYLLIDRKVDKDSGKVIWIDMILRVYYIADTPYYLSYGFWYSIGRIIGWDIKIEGNVYNYDEAEYADRVYFVQEMNKSKNKNIQDGEDGDKIFKINVRDSHLRKIEESRLETIQVSNLEEELHEMSIELKKQKALTKAEAYRHMVQSTEIELEMVGIQMLQSGYISDEVIRQEAIERLFKRGTENPTTKQLNEEIKKVREELEKEKDDLHNGKSESGLKSKLKRLDPRNYSFQNGGNQ